MFNPLTATLSAIDRMVMAARFGRRPKSRAGNLFEYRQGVFTWQLRPGISGKKCGPNVEIDGGIHYSGRVTADDGMLTIAPGLDDEYFVIRMPAYFDFSYSATSYYWAARGDVRLIQSNGWVFLIVKKDASVIWVHYNDSYQIPTAWGIQFCWTEGGMTHYSVREEDCWQFVDSKPGNDWTMLCTSRETEAEVCA